MSRSSTKLTPTVKEKVKTDTVEPQPLVEVEGSYDYGECQDISDLLSEKQSLFVENITYYELNPTAAARKAGYSSPEQTALQLKNNPKIKKAIARRREALQREFAVTKTEVVAMLRNAARMAELQSDPDVIIKAATQLGRMHGFYEPSQVRISGETKHTVTHEHMHKLSDAELIRLAGESDIIDGEIVDD